MISLRQLYEKLSPDVKSKVGDKVLGDPDGLPDRMIRKLAKLQNLSPTK